MLIVNHVIEGVSFADNGDEEMNNIHKDRPFTAHGSVPMEKTLAEIKASQRNSQQRKCLSTIVLQLGTCLSKGERTNFRYKM